MERDFYRNILIATDGSENTQRAISYGIEIAKLSGAAVYALYVVNTSPIISEYWTIGKKNVYEIIRSEGEKAVFEVKKIGEASGVEVKEVVLDGYPSNAIIDFADNNNIDLIVMGTSEKQDLISF